MGHTADVILVTVETSALFLWILHRQTLSSLHVCENIFFILYHSLQIHLDNYF